ncbi:hypothetical protein E2562_023378 [Oryza meyeriana var. granulata]|uniref:Uncharacterized protein n=1 Tax=Oryza meyeriana var. granulata TaxID=110450 RepID=A0A6G1E1M7_9ORYZ|nr:hypothetical protein E2562_023378 [Oryza meyeriana var. granulata]
MAHLLTLKATPHIFVNLVLLLEQGPRASSNLLKLKFLDQGLQPRFKVFDKLQVFDQAAGLRSGFKLFESEFKMGVSSNSKK